MPSTRQWIRDRKRMWRLAKMGDRSAQKYLYENLSVRKIFVAGRIVNLDRKFRKGKTDEQKNV